MWSRYCIRRVAGRLGLAALLSAAGLSAAARAQPPSSQPAQEKTETSDELVKRLRDGGGGEDISQRIGRLMDSSRRRLAVHFDTGEPTQRVQQQIIRELDAAIDLAKRNLRPSSRSPTSQPQQGEKRRAGRRQQEPPAKTARKGRSAEADQQSPPGGEDPEGAASEHGSTTPPTRTWGNLPDRDREAVIQGFKEAFLRKYGELIEAYYRALSEEAEE